MSVVWSGRNPVRRVDPTEFARLERAFAADVEAWLLPSSRDHDASVWNYRIRMVRAMIGRFRGSAHFVCMLGASVTGLAVADNGTANVIRLKALSTHPGQQGAGSLLIEHIVNDWPAPVAEVRLTTLDEARAFYMRLGFLSLERNQMCLDLARSPQWEWAEGRWRLKAYANLPRFATWSEEASPLPPKARLQ
ncbi:MULTISPECIES: GNAT family N-acetyltransferase [unclassified Chelatococcus]|uniref:GNAT family N-acetyltransferase n=1 Tax=unclassified Chelatococcus TaxID=2638111 RepID=UPI001BCFA60D|nr:MULTISPECIES: GNAT family N-acetyltransferase [unclassified Chelatococcus]MBS7699405.1 GNAT family N-acetyltransferase [Chelatococcus sp. YT9]MBX3557703.1 GNAT family N-acetyltransferase [Chelatococcus sp.]